MKLTLLDIGIFIISCVLAFIFYCIFIPEDVIEFTQWIRRRIRWIRSISPREVIHTMVGVVSFVFSLFLCVINICMDSTYMVIDWLVKTYMGMDWVVKTLLGRTKENARGHV